MLQDLDEGKVSGNNLIWKSEKTKYNYNIMVINAIDIFNSIQKKGASIKREQKYVG